MVGLASVMGGRAPREPRGALSRQLLRARPADTDATAAAGKIGVPWLPNRLLHPVSQHGTPILRPRASPARGVRAPIEARCLGAPHPSPLDSLNQHAPRVALHATLRLCDACPEEQRPNARDAPHPSPLDSLKQHAPTPPRPRCRASASTLPHTRFRFHASAYTLPRPRFRTRASTSALPPPRMRFHVSAYALPRPRLRCHTTASTLSPTRFRLHTPASTRPLPRFSLLISV